MELPLPFYDTYVRQGIDSLLLRFLSGSRELLVAFISNMQKTKMPENCNTSLFTK